MHVFLYDEGSAGELNMGEIAGYLGQRLGAKVEVRGNPFVSSLPRDIIPEVAREIASAKIQHPEKKISGRQNVLYAEVEYEKRRILGKTRAFGVLYDGLHLLRPFGEIIGGGKSGRDFVHIVFTNRLFATWDDGNKKYHIRTGLYALPSLISTSGLVEAPAKPREYYLLRQQYEKLGQHLAELNDRFRGRFLDYGDERLTEVAKGYAMQAVFYSLTGEPFCQDRGCRLYNAHWQEELIFAQLASGYEFCPVHTELLRKARHSVFDSSGKTSSGGEWEE